ncbi:hypothetical protein MUK42_08066 [Musa troglodytarum]|uniref:Uncharacterized protein n=1 Tax=Musa troglodytarum TaxID=320322 RepID=A0A9E7EPI0_9LILI|nr:hypothetical protein MUK42_08066 [Musa troglodytarum]
MANRYSFSRLGDRTKARYDKSHHDEHILILPLTRLSQGLLRWIDIHPLDQAVERSLLRRKPPYQNDREASSPRHHARHYSYHSHHQNKVHHTKRSMIHLTRPSLTTSS